MINNPQKVKDLIKNIAKGESGKAQLLQRRYAMERFLERVAESDYRQTLVLKGGMLVASMLDVCGRMTRDTDVTMQNKTLTIDSAVRMVEEIIAIPLDDGMSFGVENVCTIMEDSEYGGVRLEMRACMGKTDIPIRLDISTGDALTPSAIEYSYKLMLEDRSIKILAYNVETAIAEKIETMLYRKTLNTRMRDFFDIWALTNTEAYIDYKTLALAIGATSNNRNHEMRLGLYKETIDELSKNESMIKLWKDYRIKNDFASNLSWDEALLAVEKLCEEACKFYKSESIDKVS